MKTTHQISPSKPFNFVKVLSTVVRVNNGTQAGLMALKASITRTAKNISYVHILASLYLTAAIYMLVWLFVFIIVVN